MAAKFSEPYPRYGHLSAAVEGKFCVWGGHTNNFWEERDRIISSFDSFDPLKECWTSKSCSGLRSGRHGTINCASASVGRFIYMYGGSDEVKWHSSLYRLNTRSGKWKELSGIGPMKKVGCSMVATSEKLVLFGGDGFSSGPLQPGAKFVRCKRIADGRGATNELHVFDLKEGIITSCIVLFRCWFWGLYPLNSHSFMSYDVMLLGKWSSPQTTGKRPPPCSTFSFTMVDDHRAVLFGGFQGGKGRTKDVYILDLRSMVSWL